MASLPFVFTPPTVRVYAATAAKGAGSSSEKKGFLDWILGNLTKEDQFFETDPILNKVEEKSGSRSGTTSGTTSGKKNSVSVPQKKKNGGGGGVFGGLFAKK